METGGLVEQAAPTPIRVRWFRSHERRFRSHLVAVAVVAALVAVALLVPVAGHAEPAVAVAVGISEGRGATEVGMGIPCIAQACPLLVGVRQSGVATLARQLVHILHFALCTILPLGHRLQAGLGEASFREGPVCGRSSPPWP